MENYLFQMEPSFSEADAEAVADCVRSTWVIEADRTATFEKRIADYVGATYATAVPSCTVALALSLMALGIEPGDEVIVPDLTFVATANAVNLAGGVPVLADIHPNTLGLDVGAVASAITTRTRAIVPVWFNGRSPHMEDLTILAKKHGLSIVEDAACALGSRWQKKHSGTFGDLGCFSFNTTKIITTSTGGVIVTNDSHLYEQVKRLKNHGRFDRRDFHPSIGFNFLFSDLLAALGLSQMDTLQVRVEHRRTLYHWYRDRLEGVAGIDFLPLDAESCLWYVDIFVSDASNLQAFLQTRQIQSRLFFPPIHTQPAYRTGGEFRNAVAVSPRGLWLPSASYISEEDVDRVCRAILEWANSRVVL